MPPASGYRAIDAHPITRRIMRDLRVPVGTVGIHGVLYDVRGFAHPGGALWLDSVSGTDATALFELSHLRINAARHALARLPTCGTYTQVCEQDYTLYARLRAVAADLLPAGAPAPPDACSVWLACAVLAHAALLSTRVAGGARWWALCAAAATCNTVLGGYGHDALHRLHPRALLLDWNGLSGYEWLIEHVVSHHPHVNTAYDHDARSMEPVVWWDAPTRVNLVAYPLFAVGELVVAAHGYVGHRCRWHAPPSAPQWMRRAPWLFVLRLALHVAVQGWVVGAATLCATLVMASAYFSYMAHLSRAPHGDPATCIVANQLANTADVAWQAWPALALFLDRQTMHHLFPTVPHARLDATMRAALSRVLGPGAKSLTPRPDLPRVLHRRLARVPPRGKELPPQ